MIDILGPRFNTHMARHRGLEWMAVRARLELNPGKLRVLHDMARSGGEPDVVRVDAATGEIVFCDCSAERPVGRRSLCFDRAALDAAACSESEAPGQDQFLGHGLPFNHGRTRIGKRRA
ncbi:DUF4256 domain-containing protein [Pseudoduganella violaceinigra]|uniref:DUF4256 domain-containing protein n=1 Tax=Pseudoduganella violaceinigra TaxID=246602 RepID=UPI001B7FEEC6